MSVNGESQQTRDLLLVDVSMSVLCNHDFIYCSYKLSTGSLLLSQTVVAWSPWCPLGLCVSQFWSWQQEKQRYHQHQTAAVPLFAENSLAQKNQLFSTFSWHAESLGSTLNSGKQKTVRSLLDLVHAEAYHNLEGKLYLWLKWFGERANLLFTKILTSLWF